MKKLNIAVLFGGVSNEHEISLKSASYVLNSLSRSLYEVMPIGITKNGRWFFYSGSIDNIENGEWANDSKNCKPVVFSADPEFKGFLRIESDSKCVLLKVDCIFLVLHGRNGEDGRLQGFFEAASMPFVGCGSLSSANCMDKSITHQILDNAGIKTVKFKTILKRDLNKIHQFCKEVESSFSVPIFVKPANCGSSIGISKCIHINDLEKAILEAFKFDSKVICEQGLINCQEVECAVLGNDDPVTADVLGEIEAKNDFYDYDSKYKLESKLIVPANLKEDVTIKVKEVAISAFKAMECRGLARVDFLITQDEDVVVNEINTLPGFTKISMYPKLWEKSGLKGSSLMTKLIDLAMEN